MFTKGALTMMRTIRPRRGLAALILLAALALVVLSVSVLVGCGSDADTAASPSAAASAGPITATDDAGQRVTLEQPATRIVSLAPANTEIAYAIGAGDKMVAGTSYDDYPEEAKALPKVGDFANPSVEKIASFEPDLVLAAGGIQAGLRSKLEKLGMQVYVVDPKTYEGVMTAISRLGQLAGTSAQAEKVVQGMTQARDEVQAKVASLSRPSTFLEIYSKPLMTAGTDTFIDDMVTLAGGANLGATAGSGFPNFSSEVLFEDDPEVYIADSGSMSEPGAIAERPGFADLTAVKSGHVYVIDDNLIARPGPRLAEGLQELAKMIHPEAYSSQ
jgi:iron complex transport system substrate-binding protein